VITVTDTVASEAARTQPQAVRDSLVHMLWAAYEAERLGEPCLHYVLAADRGQALSEYHPDGVCFYLASQQSPAELLDRLAEFEQAHGAERLSYRERALYLALMVGSPLRGFLCDSAVISYNDPRRPGWPVLYVNHHEGQLARHIHPLDLDLFAGVDVVDGLDARALWCRAEKAIELVQLDNLRLFLMQGVRFSDG